MKLVVFATATLMVSPAIADGISIDIENFTAKRGESELALRVTNHTETDFQFVRIECAFLDADLRAIDVDNALVRNLPAGGYAYEKSSVRVSRGVENAECRVAETR